MDQLFNRKYIVQGLFIVIALILLGKLFYIQIISDKAFSSAESNVLRKIYKYPARGAILDRNMKVIVQNEPVYDLMVTPNEVKPFDTLALANALEITVEDVRKKLKKARAQSNYQATFFERQISVQSYARLQEIMYRFPGFRTQDRTVRHYPDSIAGQLFGYVKEVSPDDIEKSEGYYKPGDFIGKSGLERSYEDFLRGEKGVINTLYDARNIAQGSYAGGKYDINAVSGDRLISSLDIRIQRLGEELMKNKVGAIVAIEPSTGEILAFVSSPGYDPNQLVGKDWGKNYMSLIANPYRPQIVRPIAGQYSPGSSFKPVDALVALQDGAIDPNTTFFCPGYYMAGNHKVKCEHVDGTINMQRGIARSCNTYFCHVFQNIITKNGMKNQRQTYAQWHEQISKWGFGQKLGIDMPFEKKGIFYQGSHYDKIYGKRWGYTTVISQAIGQGEITSTPLQMANVMAAIANRGYYLKPHLIKGIGDKNVVKKEYVVKNYVGVDEKYFPIVIDGMRDAVNSPWGTAKESQIPNIVMCGKTGTVQNPHGKNHSVFIGFAPMDNPKIAIAVIVENGGFGGSYAAPISSFIVEKYLTDTIKPRSNGYTVKAFSETNLLPALIDKTKKVKLTKLDSLNIKKTDSLKKVKDSLKLKSVILKQNIVTKPKVNEPIVNHKPVTNK
ncbi:penicillin-binding protein 2 [Pedobacter riviphilus]|uniref:Penicillin-binding protein 2 n=1 Tax=Pedobacter riviphilus TaxID=2766984 RepID=A0ABX6TKL2_9SPHI|nr:MULTISPECIES: penicillin-binding protein 2 [Pedobacter]NII81500.1 penicillin-binding protein 2 [Pedobacter sp. SG908]NMN35504.1 penicillin-binding protein 2 [Pedobacter sp. SG918]QNR85451.1 penicillin-binding protein 2 [Pedobacter riviphilus]